MLTLALCTGANTAVFSLVNAVLLRALPYPHPEQLGSLHTKFSGSRFEGDQDQQNGATSELVRDHARSVDSAVGTNGTDGVNLVNAGAVRFIEQQRVGDGFFRVLGITPQLGREFTPQEDRSAAAPVAILSNALWKSDFHSDPGILGRQILLRGEPFTVVGVMPPDFRVGETPADVWTPLHAERTGEGGGTNYLVIARIAPGANWVQANAELAALSQSLFHSGAIPPGSTAQLHLVPLQKSWTAAARRPLLLLWASVILVMIIGCVNIMSLLLARAGPRAREVATRMALGGNRGAVVRQLLTESFLIAAEGSMAGTFLGFLTLRAVRKMASDSFGVGLFPASLDARVLAASIAMALFTTALFGIYPAFQMTRLDIRSALVQGGFRGASAGHRSSLRKVLVVAEVALSVMLLVGAGLLTRSFAHLMYRAPGFNPETSFPPISPCRTPATTRLQRSTGSLISH